MKIRLSIWQRLFNIGISIGRTGRGRRGGLSGNRPWKRRLDRENLAGYEGGERPAFAKVPVAELHFFDGLLNSEKDMTYNLLTISIHYS